MSRLAAERAAEGVGELLGHEQAAVRLHDDLDVAAGESKDFAWTTPAKASAAMRRREGAPR